MEYGALREDAKLTDDKIRELILLSQQGELLARDELVVHNQRLVWSVVQRFLGRGYDPEDLFQIGCIGLMKAIDKFDLTYEVKFSTYAVPMIIGEIQRFLRDDHTLKVSRSLKETARRIRATREELTKSLGRQPQINEIAEAMNLEPAEVVFAQEAMRLPASIHETVFENDGDPIYLVDQIADADAGVWFDRLTLHDALSHLPERERLIIYMRFFKDKTQAEVAEMLHISQVQVSRLEKRILTKIRGLME